MALTVTTNTAIYRPGEIVSSIEECKAPVRWDKGTGKLQQLYLIQNIGTAGHVESVV